MLQRAHPYAIPSHWAVLISMMVIAALQTLPSTALSADTPIYSDSLAAGWEKWGWGNPTSDFANSTPTHSGHASIAVTFTQGWSGFELGHLPPLNASGANTVRFWIHGGASGGQRMTFNVRNGEFTAPPLDVTAKAGVWTRVDAPLDELGSPAAVLSIYWYNPTAGAQTPFYLDDIALVTRAPDTPKPVKPGPDLKVDAGAPRRPISPYIYGMNFADEALAAELRLPVRRWGGNATTRYNWRNDTHNTAMDWYFENILHDNSNPGALPDGSATDRFVEQDVRTRTKTLMTIPLIGWTSKRRQDHPHDCGFKISKYGPQTGRDPYDTDCGDGVVSRNPDGTPKVYVTGNDPLDTSTAIKHDFVADWVRHLIGRYKTADQGGVLFYNLDNEPMLWNSTHRDVHPKPTSYDEIRERTYLYAAAIKAVDSSAKTLGPVLWGWCAYFYSAADGCAPGADYQTHGNTPLVAWYLQQMHAYEQQHNVRILDYLDLHNYPEGAGVYSNYIGDSTVQARRLRSTRSLWDPTYTDESWIPTAVSLIPRMRQWVTDYYPGTKLAISEYSWGALYYLNGALAQADILGIFGREGLDLATLWGPEMYPDPDKIPFRKYAAVMAFRMYRNYDGAGGAFGDVSVGAKSDNPDQLAIYAAVGGQNLTLMIINKTDTPLTSPVALTGFTPAATAQVYRYSAANRNAIVPEPDQVVGATGFKAIFPASSITLVVVPVRTAYRLTVSKAGTGFGTVTSSPAGINCGTDCTESYASGTRVTLTAAAAPGSRFAGWSGACTNASGTCTVAMTAAKTVKATFTRPVLTLTKRGRGSGTIISQPAGINCGADCSEPYNWGSRVVLTAKPIAGSTFVGWSGACAGSFPACFVPMRANQKVTAIFSPTHPVQIDD